MDLRFLPESLGTFNNQKSLPFTYLLKDSSFNEKDIFIFHEFLNDESIISKKQKSLFDFSEPSLSKKREKNSQKNSNVINIYLKINSIFEEKDSKNTNKIPLFLFFHQKLYNKEILDHIKNGTKININIIINYPVMAEKDSLENLLGVITLLRNLKKYKNVTLKTFAFGKITYIPFYIWLLGEEKYISKHTIMEISSPIYDFKEQFNLEESYTKRIEPLLKEILKSANLKNEVYNKIINTCFKKKLKIYLTSYNAIELSIADYII